MWGLNLSIKKMGEGKTVVCSLIQLKNGALPSNTAELRNTSLHEEFPARIAKKPFFIFQLCQDLEGLNPLIMSKAN